MSTTLVHHQNQVPSYLNLDFFHQVLFQSRQSLHILELAPIAADKVEDPKKLAKMSTINLILLE